MHAILLLMCLSGGEPFRWAVDQPSFSWQVTRGGDPESAVSPGTATLQDATPGAAGPVVCAQPAASVSLKAAIAEYRRKGGVKYFVRGKTDAQHVVEDHGWTYQQIRGLTHDEIQYLHGASHTGALSPSAFAARRVEQPSDASPADAKPRLTIKVAPFHCPPCNAVKAMDWSDFDVDWQTGGHVERGYPEISWTDAAGKKWWKAGVYKPQQVMGMIERTQ